MPKNRKNKNKPAREDDLSLEAEVAAQTAFPLGKLLMGIFGAISVLMYAICGIAAFNTRRVLAAEQSAPGRVVGFEVRSDEYGGELYYPRIMYTRAGGEQVSLQLAEGSWPPAYEKNQAVTVLYDPKQPQNARLQSFSSNLGMWTLSIITGTLGSAFLTAVALAWWITK